MLQSKKLEPFSFEKNDVSWTHPVTLDHLLEIFDKYPHAKIINGNTEVGIEVRFKNQRYTKLVNISDVYEMQMVDELENGVMIGGGVTISCLQEKLGALCQSMPAARTKPLKALLENMKYFAGKQIRNVAAIAGNICTASPISDLNPVLVAIGAILTVQSHKGGKRQISMAEFFLGYRKTALGPKEVVISIFVPFSKETIYISAFKQAKRRDDDIAIVNACFSVTLVLKEREYIIDAACFAFGGMGATTITAKKTMDALMGSKFDILIVDIAANHLLQDMPLLATSPGGQIQYRKTLAQSFFMIFVKQVLNELSGFEIDAKDHSCLNEIPRPISSGKQTFTESQANGIVGKSVVHVSANKQVTGEAQYLDDMPKHSGELYGAIVGSTIAHGEILSIDMKDALKSRGVVGYVSADDMPKSDPYANMIGPVLKDEELFATKYVHHIGQMIGMIIANSEEEAMAAAKLCKVTYKSLLAIFTLEDAIAKQSFHPGERILERGEFSSRKLNNVGIPLSDAVNTVTGIARMSGQEHFYLETNAALAVPGMEDDEMEIFSSTQNPAETQHLVAHCLGIDSNRVVCRVKRMGGGFGGKESRSVFLACAVSVAARKFGVPVRCCLSREQDMAVTGTRHPFLGNYKVGFTNEGKLVSLELDMYNNAGYSMDLSMAVLERSLTHCDNAYLIPNMRLRGRVCKTNLSSNTAFRGFGGPQGMMVAEQYMCHVAEFLGKPVEEIRVPSVA